LKKYVLFRVKDAAGAWRLAPPNPAWGAIAAAAPAADQQPRSAGLK
jgi:hypothetical protein